jgi:hypothetical protein
MKTIAVFYSPWPADGLKRQATRAIRILGTDLDTVRHSLLPGLGLMLPNWAKKPWARRFGWSLWAFGHKN